MRLITWNCKGGFQRKHAAIASWRPDVLVVPEAARFGGVPQLADGPRVSSAYWIGENPRKGLGILSYGDFTLTVDPAYDDTIKWIIPLRVSGPRTFLLLAVWTVKDHDTGYYITQLMRAVEQYRHMLIAGPAVIAGDFNQSVRLDSPNAPTFRALVHDLETVGLLSTYHQHCNCQQGEEPDPTFFLHHKPTKPHHLDYVFASRDLLARGMNVRVGRHEEWLQLSDHMPVSCTLGE